METKYRICIPAGKGPTLPVNVRDCSACEISVVACKDVAFQLAPPSVVKKRVVSIGEVVVS